MSGELTESDEARFVSDVLYICKGSTSSDLAMKSGVDSDICDNILTEMVSKQYVYSSEPDSKGRGWYSLTARGRHFYELPRTEL